MFEGSEGYRGRNRDGVKIELGQLRRLKKGWGGGGSQQ